MRSKKGASAPFFMSSSQGPPQGSRPPRSSQGPPQGSRPPPGSGPIRAGPTILTRHIENRIKTAVFRGLSKIKQVQKKL